MKTFSIIFLILSSPSFAVTGSGFGPPSVSANFMDDSRNTFSNFPSYSSTNSLFSGPDFNEDKNFEDMDKIWGHLYKESPDDFKKPNIDYNAINKPLNNTLIPDDQGSRFEFLLKSKNPSDDFWEFLKKEQFLRNQHEFNDAIELLEDGEYEAVLEDGTIIPLAKAINNYIKTNYIHK